MLRVCICTAHRHMKAWRFPEILGQVVDCDLCVHHELAIPHYWLCIYPGYVFVREWGHCVGLCDAQGRCSELPYVTKCLLVVHQV